MNPAGMVLFALAGVVVWLDQYTKQLVRTNLPLNVSWNPITWLEPFVTLTYTTNTGAAFGMFQNLGGVFVVVAFVVVVAIVLYYRRLAEGSWLLRVALGLQLGGAVGNLIDRVTRGYVTDFVDVHIWPVFNVADSSIVVGTTLLAFYAFFIDREPRRISGSQSASATSDGEAAPAPADPSGQ